VSRGLRRWGLISDTHGLLRPEALAALDGVTGIVHAGDVGTPDVLEGLARIAPVTAVRGNVDRERWADRLPETAEVEIGDEVWLHVRHIAEEIDLDPVAAGFGVVVVGHSHVPEVRERRGVLYVNPGSAGPRRFRLPVSVALLDVDGLAVSARIVEL
jgi:putative phosphoesterase